MLKHIRESVNLGTWGFLRTGWWILHIVAVVVIAYLGYYIFKWLWG